MEPHARKEVKLTTIKWQPAQRYIVVADTEKDNEDYARMKANGLISLNELSDKDLMEIGGTSKSANLANKMSEEQGSFEIVAVGPEVSFCAVGDKVIFSPGCQATSIKIDGKFYLQLGEYEVLGKHL
jgi:co-chaperonin GroES (HSP10)